MPDVMELGTWQSRFDELAVRHAVPGASVAVLAGGEVQALATGVLNARTAVAATPDSLFLIGSISKPYTATLVMGLVGEGAVALDTPVADILPELRLADREVASRVTLRHLLSHTSGIDGDLFLDTGRGDDCFERYVAACADLTQCHPLGAAFSYCNAGYVILGRVIECLTGKVWDTALRERLLDPAGLHHTWTLPEDALRFRAALGHFDRGGRTSPAPVWGLPRNHGPAGGICASAADVAAFAKLHLEAATPELAEMRRSQATVPNVYSPRDRWGLGWGLADWGGRPVFGHGGETVGQSAVLDVVPGNDFAIALAANTERFAAFRRDVYAELLPEFCDVTEPLPLAPQPVPLPPEDGRYLGVFERLGSHVEISREGGRMEIAVTPTGWIAQFEQARRSELIHVGEGRFLERGERNWWAPAVFATLPDGTDLLYLGLRAHRRVG
ncbi:MAG TPA: serine hydrolase domain-containing protein [Actinocrinis sp.]|jgi:CubicO group peptidase (beta-lactamase class C family)